MDRAYHKNPKGQNKRPNSDSSMCCFRYFYNEEEISPILFYFILLFKGENYSHMSRLRRGRVLVKKKKIERVAAIRLKAPIIQRIFKALRQIGFAREISV